MSYDKADGLFNNDLFIVFARTNCNSQDGGAYVNDAETHLR